MVRVYTLPVLLTAAVFAAPQFAAACHDVHLCVAWESEFNDAYSGESIVSPVPYEIRAAGTRVTLMRTAPEAPISRILDEDGCMTFETQFAYGHKIVGFPEAWIGTPAVHVFASERDDFNTPTLPPPYWVEDLEGVAENDTVHVILKPNRQNVFPSILGGVTQILQRFSDLGVIPAPGLDLKVTFLRKRGGAFGGCGGLVIGADRHDERYVIAHEMGHWLQCEWEARWEDPPPYDHYSYPAVDNDCKFSGSSLNPVFDLEGNPINSNAGAHGLRSAEYSSDAAAEGFAHFVAAFAFNHFESNHGIFRYYKDIKQPEYADLVMAEYRVSLQGGEALESPLGGENSWTKNRCGPDWNTEEASSEIDWLRFFWRFLAEPSSGAGDPQPTLQEVFQILAYAKANFVIDDTNIYEVLEAAIADPNSNFDQYRGRFQAANQVMGVYKP